MNYKNSWCFLVLCVSLAVSARAQLEFTNVSPAGLASQNLYAVTCGGTYNAGVGGSNYIFVAMGGGSTIATLTFSTNLTSGGVNASWVTASVPGVSGLYAGAFGANKFLVGGTNNTVFASADAVNWTNAGMVFGNAATLQGLAFNHNGFVAAASAPEIDYSFSTNLAPISWSSPATFTGLSFADSFGGVTAFNLGSPTSTNFAACGVLGRLAISSDGGQDWATAYGQVGQPDLNGIASDGGQTLLGVGGPDGGTTGSLLAFTSPGTGASLNYTLSSPTTLNAVSYIGTNDYLGANYGFLAVGNAGSVLMVSSNGSGYSDISATTANPNNRNLNGVYFATSGLFKGVGVLVGNNGTIIVAGTPPPPPATNATSSATNCVSWPLTPANNNPLSVWVATNVFYPAGTLTVDWYATTNANAMAVTNGTLVFYPTNNPNLTGANTNFVATYYAQTRDLRTGFTSTNRTPVTITLCPRPTSTTVTTNMICTGQGTTITNVLTGIGPWTVAWANNNGATLVQSVTNAVPGPYTNTLSLPASAFAVTDQFPNQSTNCLFWVTQVVSSNLVGAVLCTNVAAGLLGTNDEVVVYPLPTSTTVTTNMICAGQGTTITNVLTGIGPWTVAWANNNGATLVQSVTNAVPGPYTNTLYLPANAFGLNDTFTNQATNCLFWVTQVVSSNDVAGVSAVLCTNLAGGLLGTNDEVIVYPAPTSTTVTTNLICTGSQTTITNVLTGIGPWTVTWANNSGATVVQSVTNAVSGPYVNSLSLPSGGFSVADLFPNQSSNCQFWVRQVVSSNYVAGVSAVLCTNLTSGLLGTNDEVMVYPQPTSATVTTNQISNGQGTTITNVLTGIGPWTVTWANNNGATLVQSVTNAVAGPYLNTLSLPGSGFSVTDLFTNQPTNCLFWVTQVVSSNFVGSVPAVLCTNLTSGLLGTNDEVIVYPLPTSTTVTTNQISNGQGTTITNVLTGIGPWTVTWANNNGVTLVQSVTNAVAGPYLNTLSLPGGGFSVTDLFANQSSNCLFWVTQVVSSNFVASVPAVVCTNVTSGLMGTNDEVIVDPLPTSATGGTNEICNGLGVTLTNVLNGVGPWTVYWTNGVVGYVQSVATNGSGGSVTSTLTLPIGGFTLTNSFANASTNYLFWVTQVVSSNGVGGTLCTNTTSGISGTNVVLVDPVPTSTALTTNVICNNDAASVTNVLTGANGAWFVAWTDGNNTYVQTVTNPAPGLNLTNILSLPGNGFTVSNPNQTAVIVTNAYWVTQVVWSNQLSGYTCASSVGGLAGTNVVVIYPVLTNAPASNGNVTNVYYLSSALSVTNVPAGFTVDWFDASNNLVLPGTNVYVASPVGLGPNAATNSSVTNTFYALARFVDTNSPSDTNCYSPAASVSLVSVASPYLTFTASGGSLILQWSGNYYLESATNLVNSNTVWMDVTNYGVGTHSVTNSTTVPPVEFFRLSPSTN